MSADVESKPIRVLIVDDDPITRFMAATALGAIGMQVTEAGEGGQALALLEGQPLPAIVLLDVVMPGMDGFEVCARVRALPGGEHLPILMMTGLNDQASIRRAYEVGATDFVVKPIGLELLGHRVRYMVRAGQAVEQLFHSQRRLAAAQRMARLGHWEWSLERGCIVWSERALEIVGDEAGQHSLEDFLGRVPADERPRVASWLATLAEIRAPAEMSHRILNAAGEERHLLQFVEPDLDGAGRLLRLYGAVQDITLLRRAEKHIHQLAYYDTLTGLPNRVHFLQQLDKALRGAQRQRRGGALLFLDLDNFKKINDTLGHHHGDLLLQAVAQRLVSSLRTCDLVARGDGGDERDYLARLGGDELTVLLPMLRSSADAGRVAGRILEVLGRPFSLAGHEVVITPSIGITLFPQDGSQAPELLRAGDLAMYHAKRAGKNTFKYFDASLNEAALYRLKLEEGLRQAIKRQELRLYFQPQIDVRSGALRGLEALLRWRSPDLGEVAPAQLIPVAEETGLILPIGAWVMETACRALRRWQGAGCPIQRVAVNVSASQFDSRGFPAQVAQILAATGLDPACLELELTETLLMSQAEDSVRTLRALKDVGVLLAIDDFGTGYSSLSYLKRFPIDRLKIDKSFIHNIEHDKNNAAIVQAVIAMAASMSLEVTAEGVEQSGQLEYLRCRDCNEVQGFLFSRPVPAEEIPDLVRRFTGPADVASR
jgi:predicted signal transduction protein with EAL and GGDEF domain/DNA-binding response OmpR family regulator